MSGESLAWTLVFVPAVLGYFARSRGFGSSGPLRVRGYVAARSWYLRSDGTALVISTAWTRVQQLWLVGWGLGLICPPPLLLVLVLLLVLATPVALGFQLVLRAVPGGASLASRWYGLRHGARDLHAARFEYDVDFDDEERLALLDTDGKRLALLVAPHDAGELISHFRDFGLRDVFRVNGLPSEAASGRAGPYRSPRSEPVEATLDSLRAAICAGRFAKASRVFDGLPGRLGPMPFLAWTHPRAARFGIEFRCLRSARGRPWIVTRGTRRLLVGLDGEVVCDARPEDLRLLQHIRIID